MHAACKKWHTSQGEDSLDEFEPEEEGEVIRESVEPQGTEDDRSAPNRYSYIVHIHTVYYVYM